MELKQHLLQIDEQLDSLSKEITFFDFNPINEREEKKLFFSVNDYNPQFKYHWNVDYSSVIKQLEQTKIRNGALGKIFEEKRLEYINKATALLCRGTGEFTKWGVKVYGKPSKKLVLNAKRLVKLKPEPAEKKVKTKEITRKFQYAFIRYGFNWKIEEREMPANAAVNISNKSLYLKKNAKFSEDFIKRLIVHEVGTHILRAENGGKQPYKIFLRGLSNSIAAEEGLAVFNEEKHGCLNKQTLKTYAGRVLAVDKALNCSFRETYDHLRKYFGKEEAWRLTVRAKRGMGDTSKKGALTKDHLYLKGYCDIKQYVAGGGDIKRLYYGRIGINHIKYLNQIPGLLNPTYLPMFRYFNYFAGMFSSFITVNLKKYFTRPFGCPAEASNAKHK